MLTADRVIVTTLVENYTDFLLPSTENVKRVGLQQQFDPRHGPLQTDNGIGFLVEVMSGSEKCTILMDAGFGSSVLLHNMKLLGFKPSDIDHIVISHGHPDHCGGLISVLEAAEKPTPVCIHPDAFHPRYILLPTGGVIGPYNYMILDRSKIEKAGGVLISTTNSVVLGPGTATSGEIERTEDFEKLKYPLPETVARLFHVKNGIFREDPTLDDQALIINLKGKGLIVITGCAHAGAITTIKHAQRISNVDKVHAYIGGTHLGFSGVTREKIERTITELKKIKLTIISPMHCSGFRAISMIAERMPDEFVINSTGTKIIMSET